MKEEMQSRLIGIAILLGVPGVLFLGALAMRTPLGFIIIGGTLLTMFIGLWFWILLGQFTLPLIFPKWFK